MKYKCNKCNKLYDVKSEAINCCPNITEMPDYPIIDRFITCLNNDLDMPDWKFLSLTTSFFDAPFEEVLIIETDEKIFPCEKIFNYTFDIHMTILKEYDKNNSFDGLVQYIKFSYIIQRKSFIKNYVD